MPQHEGTRLLTGDRLDLAGYRVGNSADATGFTRQRLTHGRFSPASRERAFRRDHDREVPAGAVALHDLLADLPNVVGDFGDEDHVCSARQPAVERDEAGMPAHDLHDDDTVVALGGGVQLVDGLEGGVYRRVE